MVELVGGGSVINGAYPVWFLEKLHPFVNFLDYILGAAIPTYVIRDYCTKNFHFLHQFNVLFIQLHSSGELMIFGEVNDQGQVCYMDIVF